MKQVLINTLIASRLGNIPIKERSEVVKRLKTDYNMSYRQLEEKSGYSKSTLQDWVSGRQKNVPGCLHISITQLIKHFKIYEPKTLQEWCRLIELKTILDERIKKDSPKSKVDKQVGWEE